MDDTANMAGRPVLVTGATGYVGGRLRRRLEAAGARVRCLARDPQRLEGRIAAGTEVVAGDVLAPATLPAALAGVDTAYYLVHSIGAASGFEARDREGATNFARAAAAAGVRRLVYLGGLGDDTAELSPHLRSRNEVGRILRESGVPTVELRASIVLGSGSLSFEMIRSLTERLPVMITPSWVRVLAQPIAVADLLDYLEAAATVPLAASRVYEIGGADRVSYGDLMREYARQRGLRRPMVPVPLLTPWLSSLWLGLVTPLYARIGRKLIQSIQHPTIVRDDAALRDFPLRPVGMAEAIARALAAESRGPETRWCDAVSSSGAERSLAGVRYRGRHLDARRLEVPVPPERAFAPIAALGGNRGWYAWDQLWRLRGALDLLVGGVGLRRGRSHPSELRVGDVLDCWRVEAVEPGRLLRLRAEMKLPGRAWLEFAVEPRPGGSLISQTAVFDPVGLGGLLYWYAVYPFHHFVFRDMLRGIGRAAAGS
ncbi:MAG: SDR family oxidoreductase [Candidatus Krumholzibacteriia bacterium]